MPAACYNIYTKFPEHVPEVFMRFIFSLLLLYSAVCLSAAEPDPTAAQKFIAASENGDIKTLNSLLKKGMDINATAENRNALLAAMEKQDLKTVKWLLDHKADPNGRGPLSPPALVVLPEPYNPELARLLLSNGADPSRMSYNFKAPLHRALELDSLEYIRLLLDKGASVNFNIRGETILMAACTFKNAAVVRLLLERGADANASYQDQSTALHRAAATGCPECIQALIEYGADIHYQGSTGFPPLFAAVFSGSSSEHAKCVDMLIKAGAETTGRDYRGRTLYELAEAADNPAIIQLLEQYKKSQSWWTRFWQWLAEKWSDFLSFFF